MAARILTLAAATIAVAFFTFQAFAAKTCVIVVAADRPSSAEIYRHELAHCNGWEHPDQNHGMFGPKRAYQSPKPPAKFVRPYAGKLVDHWVSTKEAVKICGSYGCQWFD
jgi:hypothetical protein